MLTHREKLEVLIAKLQTHDYFENPYKLTKGEADTILKTLIFHKDKLEYSHGRYLVKREDYLEKAKKRYHENKEEITAKRRKRMFDKVMEGK